MPWDRFVLGYHGCDESVVNDVVLGKKTLKKSENDYDWLGNGAYFWEDSYARALQWAKSDKRIKTSAVLGAVINLGNCLNLLDVEHLELVREAYYSLNEASEAAEISMPQNQGQDFRLRKLDCAVIETLHQIREDKQLAPFDTVRGFLSKEHHCIQARVFDGRTTFSFASAMRPTSSVFLFRIGPPNSRLSMTLACANSIAPPFRRPRLRHSSGRFELGRRRAESGGAGGKRKTSNARL